MYVNKTNDGAVTDDLHHHPLPPTCQASSSGIVQKAVEFTVRVVGIKFQYYLLTTFNPRYNTFTWTLDYNTSLKSDFGKWEVGVGRRGRGRERLYVCLGHR